MLVSYNWLHELVDFEWSPEELAHKMTMAGLEFEGLEKVGNYKLDKLIIGKVVSAVPHTDSDHLTCCKVNIGSEEVSLICGAPNVAEGQIVPVALPGVTLPNGFTIEKARIRGFDSFGMICSERELGISDDHKGIMVLDNSYKTGAPFTFKTEEDIIFDFSITPNRPDFMNMIGVAREIAILTGNELKKPVISFEKEQKDGPEIIVEIDDPDGCPRFSCRVIEGVKVGPSPVKISRRLNSLGFKSINNIVDATNYVLLERGHPLHAYDLNNIKDNTIHVRRARKKETFTTLDKINRQLHVDDVMICDGRRTIGLGGVMGGKNSEVKNNSKDLLLECAYFNPVNVRWTAKRQVLSTEASKRFERGADPDDTLASLDRLTQVIQDLSEGCKVYETIDKYPRKIPAVTIPFRYSRVKTVLGVEIPEKQINNIFSGLECEIKKDKSGIKVTAPSFRPDLSREIDLVEEVARIYDYDNIEPVFIDHVSILSEENKKEKLIKLTREIFLGLGMDEIFSNSMEEPQKYPLLIAEGKPLTIKNPVSSEMSVLRQSLIPGLYRALIFNFNRDQDQIRLFETGKVFGAGIGDSVEKDERLCIGGIIQGNEQPHGWRSNPAEVDLFTVKGILERYFSKILLDNVEINPYAKLAVSGIYEIIYSGKRLGFFGQIHHTWFKIPQKQKLFFWEIDFLILHDIVDLKHRFSPISSFPAVKRDIALVVNRDVEFEGIKNFISSLGGELLNSIMLFDIYSGEQIAGDKKSIAISLKFQSMVKSLTDEEVQEYIDKILSGLQNKYQAVLRT